MVNSADEVVGVCEGFLFRFVDVVFVHAEEPIGPPTQSASGVVLVVLGRVLTCEGEARKIFGMRRDEIFRGIPETTWEIIAPLLPSTAEKSAGRFG